MGKLLNWNCGPPCDNCHCYVRDANLKITSLVSTAFGSIGSNIGISDIDGMVERNGRLLLFEIKRPGERFNPAQARKITYSTELLYPDVQWVAVEFNAGDSHLRRQWVQRGEWVKVPAAVVSDDSFVKEIVDWYHWANKQPPAQNARIVQAARRLHRQTAASYRPDVHNRRPFAAPRPFAGRGSWAASENQCYPGVTLILPRRPVHSPAGGVGRHPKGVTLG